MAECQAECRFLSSPPPPPPPFLPSLLVSRPALLRTSVGMYPPLNRSHWATAGSLTAQYGSSINQRHFQCPITETLLLGLSEADSSPIHLLGEKKKKKSHCGTPVAFTCSNEGLLRAQEDPSEIVFSRSGKQQKKVNCLSQVTHRGSLVVAGGSRGKRGWAEEWVSGKISGWRCVC